MTREERIQVCETCKHCQMNIERGILCGFTNEYADFDDTCHLYEPSNKQQAKTRAKQIIDRMKESSDKGLSVDGYIGIIVTYLFCLISTLVGDNAKPSSIMAIGFVLIALICLDYYYFKYKRKKKVFGELTSSSIEQVVKIEGYYPYKEEGDIYFKSDGRIYRIIHKAPRFSLLLQGPFDGEYEIALRAATIAMKNTIIGKVYVSEQSTESSSLIITISAESLIHYTEELRANFASYFDIINVVLTQFLEEYNNQLKMAVQTWNKTHNKTS